MSVAGVSWQAQTFINLHVLIRPAVGGYVAKGSLGRLDACAQHKVRSLVGRHMQPTEGSNRRR